MSKGEAIPYAEALRIAKRHLIPLAMLDSTEKITIVGSVRRKCDRVRDIDYQIIGSPHDVKKYFYRKEWYVEEAGSKRQVFKAPSGLYINCFFTHQDNWGAALMHNTGPSRYNIRKRYLIKKKGWTLNQYALYKPNDEGLYDIVAGKTEKDIYDALGWAYCEPEDRI